MPLDDNAQYWIARGAETFGPYSGAQVRAYVASGNIAPADRIRGEAQSEWTTVALAIGSAPPPVGGAPATWSPSVGAPTGFPAADPGKAFAWTSLVLGVVGLLCCGVITAIPGVIFAILALRGPSGPSRGVAVAGLIVSIIALIFGILAILVMVYFPQFLPQGFSGPGGFGNP